MTYNNENAMMETKKDFILPAMVEDDCISVDVSLSLIHISAGLCCFDMLHNALCCGGVPCGGSSRCVG